MVVARRRFTRIKSGQIVPKVPEPLTQSLRRGVSVLRELKSFFWRPNQSLKLTAEAQVVSRYAQENDLVVAARRQCETVFRIVR
jgi:hypothetical protein